MTSPGAQRLAKLLKARHGHYRFESGLHGGTWLELDALFTAPDALQPCISELAERLAPHGPEVICGPETGGARLAAALGRELGLPAFVAHRHVASEGSVQYTLDATAPALLHERRVALVDDAISAGSAIRATAQALQAQRSRLVAIGSLLVLGQWADAFAQQQRVPLETLERRPHLFWPAATCPMCAAGLPLDEQP